MLRNLYLDWDSHPSFLLSIKVTGLCTKEYYGHTTNGVTRIMLAGEPLVSTDLLRLHLTKGSM